MMRIILGTLTLLLGATGAFCNPLPNIVCFFSDDLGRLDTSIHGSKVVRTPTIKKLAGMGLVFDNAYVASPSCCPNRASLLTGLMPVRHGAEPNHTPIKEGTPFLTKPLKDAGYTIASFGKVAHGGKPIAHTDHHTKPPMDMHKDVQKYLKDKNPVEPLCLLVGDRRPHVTWTKTATYDPTEVTLPEHFIDTLETREHRARYYTDITNMDAEMGRILNIAQRRFGDNFIFLFTSDHGGQWPWGKWNLYDSGARVPLVIAWPGKIKPGTRTNAMVSWVDLFPTLIDIAGLNVPTEIDGRSFKPVLLGKTDAHRDVIHTTHTGDGIMNIYPMRSVRIGKWKYIRNLTPHAYHTNHSNFLGRDGAGAFWASWHAAAEKDPAAAKKLKRYFQRDTEELFDLEKDPEEQHNLANNPEYKDKLTELSANVTAWMTANKDEGLIHNTPYPLDQPLPKIQKNKKRKK